MILNGPPLLVYLLPTLRGHSGRTTSIMRPLFSRMTQFNANLYDVSFHPSFLATSIYDASEPLFFPFFPVNSSIPRGPIVRRERWFEKCLPLNPFPVPRHRIFSSTDLGPSLYSGRGPLSLVGVSLRSGTVLLPFPPSTPRIHIM